MDTALLILRLVVGLLVAGHGSHHPGGVDLGVLYLARGGPDAGRAAVVERRI
jgi:hypothetical protein